MTIAQSGIVPEGSRFAMFLVLHVEQGVSRVRDIAKQFPAMVQQYAESDPQAELSGTWAFGEALWRTLAGDEEAPELKSFVELGEAPYLAPSTQEDLFIHIHSQRHDLNYVLAQAVLNALGDCVTVTDEQHGFRYLDARDMTGFIDGTENPHGDEARQQVGVIEEGPDQGGSYILVQRYAHNLPKWHAQSEEDQEKTIGRTKVDSEELEPEQRFANSHVSRVDLKEEGKGLKILRHSLPYGKVSDEHGLYFCAYCHSLRNIEQQLLSMFGGMEDGQYDRLLKYTRAVTGGYYFAPSRTRLEQL
ncbi:peroxidase [Plesiomonas shigelloides]|uniref:Dyp-type peroxidase n=1 Tax=Plesiomonas shigelloides TaxID=703 RepID=UPI000D577B16|nr:Dyp-type peroxidase [Plesiomonas shigelloides]PVU65993.1 peroxidase [Plesiomonas shigelloides]